MSQDYLRRQTSVIQRTSTISSVVLRTHDEDYVNPISASINSQRQLSAISQIYLPNGNEYYPQDRLPPTGPEAQQPFILATLNNDYVDEDDDENNRVHKRVSILTSVCPTIAEETDEEFKDKKLNKKTRRILFIIEPILCGFLLFPMIVLFWQSGWNLNTIFLNYFNQFSTNLTLNEITTDNAVSYEWKLLVLPYLITQFILLLYYLCQNNIYNYLKQRHWIVENLLLKLHIFILATLYIIQWQILWTIWDYFIPHEWYFELTLSLTALFAFIVFNGHLSDLVCAPFLFSYDSIEYSIHFGCPLLTREMKEWKINLINFILYEIIVSNLSIMTWRGFYSFLDNYFFPNDLNMSIGLSFIIGYLIYFILMYFQTYLEELNMKYEFWTFVSINFPQFYRNIRHFFAFISCVFIWRAYWVFYDNYIYMFESHFKTSLLLYLLPYLVLSIAQTASSINGPLSHINERNNFFPLYPHCYISIVQRKLSQLFSSKPKSSENNFELSS